METVVGLFDYIAEAEGTVLALEKAGIARENISVMADNTRRHEDQYSSGSASSAEDLQDVIKVDATAGAALGGATGLLMALTGLVIPGFGAVVAAGWLVSTLAGAAVGAAAGGLVGGLTGAGIPLEDALYYREGIKAGATLIAVRTEPAHAMEIAAIMEAQGAVNITERAEEYRRQGLLSPTDNSVLLRPVTEPITTPLVVEDPTPAGTTPHIYPASPASED